MIRRKTLIMLFFLLGFAALLIAQQKTEVDTVLPPKIEGKVHYRRFYNYGQWILEYQYRGNVKDLHPIEYENASNSQKVIKRTDSVIFMRNTANLMPFTSTIPFPVEKRYHAYTRLPKEYRPEVNIKQGNVIYIEIGKNKTPSGDPPNKYLALGDISNEDRMYLKKIADETVAGAKLQAEAVEKLMEYMRANVRYSLGVSTNPADVLKNGSAYCMGYASAAVYLLRTQGIPARYVVCYMPPGLNWGFGGSGGFHEFLEVYYDDLGWVSYDPQHSVHFVDPYHIVLGYPDEGHYEDRSIVSRLVKGIYRENTVTLASDPIIYNRFYYPFFVRPRADIFEKLSIVPVKIELESFSSDAKYSLLAQKDENSKKANPYIYSFSGHDRLVRKNSISNMFDGFFYIAQKPGETSKYSLKAEGKGASFTMPFEVPDNAREVKLDPKNAAVTFQLMGKGGAQAGASVLIAKNFESRKHQLQFNKLGITDNNGILMTDACEEGDTIVQAYIEKTPRLFAVTLKKGTIVECVHPLDADADTKNFLRINGLLKTPVSLLGKISLPDGKTSPGGNLWLVKNNGGKILLNIDRTGMFQYESYKKDEEPVQIMYSNGQCVGSLALAKKADRVEGYCCFDFVGKSVQAEVRSPEAYMYTLTDDGYVYTALRPGQEKRLYLLSDKKEFFLGSSADALDVTRLVPGNSGKLIVGAGGTPEELATRYELFARNVKRKESWSVFGYFKNTEGAFENGYEAFRQLGSYYNRFAVHSSGAFVQYGKPHPGGIRIVLKKSGYYYKSGILDIGHFSAKADFSTGEYLTVRRKADSARKEVYVHTPDGNTDVAVYDADGKALIRVDGEFSLSPDAVAGNAVSVKEMGKGGSLEI